MPSRDAQWIIGTIVAVGIALSVQIAGARTAMRDLDVRLMAEIADLDARLTAQIERLDARLTAQIAGLDARLRSVEVAVAKVEQRLATLERLQLPSAGAEPELSGTRENGSNEPRQADARASGPVAGLPVEASQDP